MKLNKFIIISGGIVGGLIGSLVGAILTDLISTKFLINLLSTFSGVILAAILSWILYQWKQRNIEKNYKRILRKDLEDKRETIVNIKNTIKEVSKREKLNDIVIGILDHKVQAPPYLDTMLLNSLVHSAQVNIFSREIVEAYQEIDVTKNQISFIANRAETRVNLPISFQSKENEIKLYKNLLSSLIAQIENTKKQCDKALKILTKKK
jgi:hypothetical protein